MDFDEGAAELNKELAEMQLGLDTSLVHLATQSPPDPSSSLLLSSLELSDAQVYEP